VLTQIHPMRILGGHNQPKDMLIIRFLPGAHHQFKIHLIVIGIKSPSLYTLLLRMFTL
jgi:hypothetical protein